jgi:hypothetical protein
VILLLIEEIPGFNLGLAPAYLDEDFSWFSPIFPKVRGLVPAVTVRYFQYQQKSKSTEYYTSISGNLMNFYIVCLLFIHSCFIF